MCVAVPGRVIEIIGDTAKVNVLDNICDVNISLVSAKEGDYVLVHAGCAIEVMKKDMAEEMIDLFNELEEVCDEDPAAGEK